MEKPVQKESSTGEEEDSSDSNNHYVTRRKDSVEEIIEDEIAPVREKKIDDFLWNIWF